MAKSKVVVTFNSIPQVGDRLEILKTISLNQLLIFESFSIIRDANYITKIGAKMIHISKVQLIDVSSMGLFYYLFFLFN